MTQKGIIQRIDGDKVFVEINHKERGPGEPVMACCSDASTVIEARNTSGLPLNPGDTVDLQTPSGSIAMAGLIGFGVPLVCFFVGYGLAANVFGITSSLGQAGVGLGGLLIGLAAPLLYFRLRPQKDALPEIRPSSL